MSTDLRSRALYEQPSAPLAPAASDCKSAMNAANKFWKPQIGSHLHSITNFIGRQMGELDMQIKEDSQVTWIKSHPEKRAEKKDWNEDDRRIAIADDVASGHHRLEDIENCAGNHLFDFQTGKRLL